MQEISIKAEQLFTLAGFPVTNSLLLTLVAGFVLVALSFLIRLRIKLVPGNLQSGVEMMMEWFLGLMQSTLGSKKAAEKYFPLIITIFVLILTSNLLGILPGVGSLSFNSAPLFRSPAADLNFTLAFALVSVILSNIIGMMAVGVLPHISKFINFSGPIKFFIGILELISELAKIISLSFRLFGNVFAGEVLLIIVFFLAPYIIPLPFLFLEIFVGLIQAFLFAMLTLVSISLHTSIYQED